MHVGYVLKVFPRFSETFIINEILAHETAGLDLEIFSLRPPLEGRFHESLARIRANVTYLPYQDVKAIALWNAWRSACADFPGAAAVFEPATQEDVRDVYQALQLAQLARERDITHLHAHFGSVATTVARLAARIAGLPYSFTAHAKDIFHESVRVDDLRAKLADAAAVVTVSDYNLAHLREIFGSAAATVQRIYNGLDLAQFSFGSPAVREPLILGVGRLVEKKGWADLIEACAQLARRGVPFRCVIVGQGPLDKALQGQIVGLGVAEQVTLAGPRSQDAVIKLIRSAAVFAAPCIVGADGNRDGLPTVLLEAMALGTPCVSTDVTGIPEVLRDGETGLEVPQHSPALLALALERLLVDAPLRMKLAQTARRRIEAEFDIHLNSARQRALFSAGATPTAGLAPLRGMAAPTAGV